jgi:hypothetical protein
MDERKRQLVALIIQDAIDRHTRDADTQFSQFSTELLRQGQERGYNSRRWVHEASIAENQAKQFIKEVSEKIRAETLDAEAAEAYVFGAHTFLGLLSSKYEHRFKMAKPFMGITRDIGLPVYWANLGEGLQRKIEIERLKFDEHAPCNTKNPNNFETAATTPKRAKPTDRHLNEWANKVGNVARDKITSDFIGETWKHNSPNVRPTVTEAQGALNQVYGKRSRGRPKNSNPK